MKIWLVWKNNKIKRQLAYLLYSNLKENWFKISEKDIKTNDYWQLILDKYQQELQRLNNNDNLILVDTLLDLFKNAELKLWFENEITKIILSSLKNYINKYNSLIVFLDLKNNEENNIIKILKPLYKWNLIYYYSNSSSKNIENIIKQII